MIVKSYSNKFGDCASVEVSVDTHKGKIDVIYKRCLDGRSATSVCKPQLFKTILESFDDFVVGCEKRCTGLDFGKENE